jgi:hypothetical protein
MVAAPGREREKRVGLEIVRFSRDAAPGEVVRVDAKRGALWVCSGSSGFATVSMTPSALKRYSLASGAPQASYPMPDDGYCNDLAQDKSSNLYITDSFHPRVLRLTPGPRRLPFGRKILCSPVPGRTQVLTASPSKGVATSM